MPGHVQRDCDLGAPPHLHRRPLQQPVGKTHSRYSQAVFARLQLQKAVTPVRPGLHFHALARLLVDGGNARTGHCCAMRIAHAPAKGAAQAGLRPQGRNDQGKKTQG